MSTERQTALDAIYKSFQLSDSKLQEITQHFLDDFSKGLRGDPNGLAMIPAYVTRIPDGSERGSFLVLDFEWTAFRVSQIQLQGKQKFASVDKVFEIAPQLKSGELSTFVDYLVTSIKSFVEENRLNGTASNPIPFGVTFPFQLKKTSPSRSVIAGWSKGFALRSGVGEDILKLLEQGLARKGVYIRGAAIINDTVATTLAQGYLSNKCALGAIFGIGTNAAIVENASNIKSLQKSLGGQMFVNTEWGAFGSGKKIIPTTPYDRKLQRESVRPGFHVYEKLIGWMYLGEIVRNVVTSLIDQDILFNGTSTPVLNTSFGLDTYVVAQIDGAASIQDVKALLVEHLQFQPDTISDADAKIIRTIAEQVGTRAARLSSVGIAAALIHGGYAKLGGGRSTSGKITLAISGELILLYPKFESRVRQGLDALVGAEVEKDVEFKVIADPSALGAALAVYETQNRA
ncbi:hypothetical protein BOTBODRAFT_163476 [Botryobasidium botryosum FD-172 SS1]|uniref:Phosphotransferase n=1 Tax=Botryobasidium botryosum (strain FD-172 SS1) TaxID=930990 RepID=A0A067MG44_BOTB1|nr:hypothetical protein BOTBODRAFT_163476 [Botryobasidium botryosum FD-172 SS1]